MAVLALLLVFFFLRDSDRAAGSFVSGVVAVLVALADGGPVIALWALGVGPAVQVLEGNVFQPMASRTVRIHPG